MKNFRDFCGSKKTLITIFSWKYNQLCKNTILNMNRENEVLIWFLMSTIAIKSKWLSTIGRPRSEGRELVGLFFSEIFGNVSIMPKVHDNVYIKMWFFIVRPKFLRWKYSRIVNHSNALSLAILKIT